LGLERWGASGLVFLSDGRASEEPRLLESRAAAPVPGLAGHSVADHDGGRRPGRHGGRGPPARARVAERLAGNSVCAPATISRETKKRVV